MRRFATTVIALLLASAANAFQPSLPRLSMTPKVSPSTSSTARHIILTEDETESILKTASVCVNGECSSDDVTELIATLKEQQDVLEDRLEKIMNMVSHLQHVNEKEERKTDEVRQFVKDMLRVFNHGDGGYPISFSGDIGDGPTTAYDALPPKKWKP